MTSEKISKRKVFFLEHHISRLKQLFNDTRNRSETERERKEFRLVDVAMWMKFAYEKEHFKHFIYLSLCDLHSLSCSWSWFLLFACFSLSVSLILTTLKTVFLKILILDLRISLFLNEKSLRKAKRCVWERIKLNFLIFFWYNVIFFLISFFLNQSCSVIEFVRSVEITQTHNDILMHMK